MGIEGVELGNSFLAKFDGFQKLTAGGVVLSVFDIDYNLGRFYFRGGI